MVSMFTERPLRVLYFVLRLSWGCGHHSAYIPRQKDFELCGVREGHIKQVLDWLINANVIIRDGDYYQINKDFDHWHVSRAFNFGPEKLTELVSLNLNNPDQDLRELTELVRNREQELTKKVSQNLPKREETTYQKGKFLTPEPASPKESIKEIYILDKNILINTLSGEEIKLTELVSSDARTVWDLALEEIKKNVSILNYKSWFEKTAGLAQLDNHFLIRVCDKFHAEHLRDNFYSMIERALIEVTDNHPEIYFVISRN